MEVAEVNGMLLQMAVWTPKQQCSSHPGLLVLVLMTAQSAA